MAKQQGFWSWTCDLCGESVRRAWRYAWRPADPEPRRCLALHWNCAETLCRLEPETWAYKGMRKFKLYMWGFEKGDTLILGEWPWWERHKKTLSKRRIEAGRDRDYD